MGLLRNVGIIVVFTLSIKSIKMILSKSLDCTVLYGITVTAVIVQECSLFRNFQNQLLFSEDIL